MYRIEKIKRKKKLRKKVDNTRRERKEIRDLKSNTLDKRSEYEYKEESKT